MTRIVECIPNFSEGRRIEVVDAIVSEISKVEGIRVLDKEMDKDHNRAVVTFIGEPDEVLEAAFAGCAKAAEVIDLNVHKGEHPRIGATDVIPLVPIRGISVEECIVLARRLGEKIANELKIPVYLYEKAATSPERENLAVLREGEYEGLKVEIERNQKRKPDFGEPKLHPTAGATVVGVREPLIAFNVNLGTARLDIAKEIAKKVRFRDGGLRFVKANGFALRERGIVQVSMNLVNYTGTPIYEAFEMVKREAERYGISVVGTEIVGLVPLQAIVDTADFYLRLEHFKPEQILENKLWGGGVVEKIPTLFLDEVASKAPTPGGGSVAALAGALSASLGCMVSRITIGKKKYANVVSDFREILYKLEPIRSKLTELIEKDGSAFQSVLKALKLPHDTEEESEIRKIALENAYKEAIDIPIQVMEEGGKLLELLGIVAEKGDRNALSDIGVGISMSMAAVEGAEMVAKINLFGLTDNEYRALIENKIEKLKEQAEIRKIDVLKIVKDRLKRDKNEE